MSEPQKTDRELLEELLEITGEMDDLFDFPTTEHNKIKEIRSRLPPIKGCATCQDEHNSRYSQLCYECVYNERNLNQFEDRWRAKGVRT